MAEAGPEEPPAADLEAAIDALPIKKEAVREAFERLATCSPYPLPFTWEGLDAHISGIQSSISRRYRQLQVLEAAQPARVVPAPVTTRSSDSQQQKQEEAEEEEVVEVEVEVEEDEEEDGEENDDGEDEDGEEEEEEEIEEEVVEEEEVEEEVVEEAEDAARDEGKQEADEEMQLIHEEGQNSKEEPEARGMEEQNADDEVLPDKKEKEVEEVHQEGKEEQEEEKEPPYVEPGTKNAEVTPKEDMIQKQIQRAPASRSKDLMAACASMDANTLVKFISCNRAALGKELPIAMRHAPDAAALALQVVKLFLSSKKFKATKVWNNCVSLLRCVPVAASKPSLDTIEQAKRVANDWKEIIYKLECPGDLELLSARGLLYFLMSYNIVSEFDTSEIIRLFSMIPRHMQKKNTMELCKGLGIADRITDLLDYLILKGQELKVFHLSHVFNLSDKYPLLPLLKGYIETAKRTSMEIQSKSLNSAIPKEIDNLWVAHHLAKQKITDSSQRCALMAEIKTLLDGYATKKKRLAKACTSNIQTQPKKCKKEKQELHKGQESLQQDQQSKAQEQRHRQNNAQQKQQKQESHMRENEQQRPKNRLQETQIHQHNLKRPRPCTPKLPTPVVPVVLDAAQIVHFGHPPYSATPGVRGAPIFALPLDAAQYIRPFNPFYPHPQFYPR